MSEEREEREQHWTAQVIALLQERNTLLLEAVGELRDIHRGVDALVAALPQPPSRLKRAVMIFGEPQI